MACHAIMADTEFLPDEPSKLSRPLSGTIGSIRRRAAFVVDRMHVTPNTVLQRLTSFHSEGAPETDRLKSLAERYEAHHRPLSLQKVIQETHFNRKEVQSIYRSFKQTAPSGFVDLSTFRYVFEALFPHSNAETYAEFVFDTFDLDRNGTISFEEFVRSLSVLSRGTLDEKLNWVYRLYDNKGLGYITWDRLFALIGSMNDIIGREPRSQCTKDKRIAHTNEIFEKLDLDKDGVISRDEFFMACKQDETIRESIAALNTILIV